MNSPAHPPISVVVVNYNCRVWLERFFPSLQQQTIFEQVEIIIVDNTSTDGSAETCRQQMAAWPNGVFLPTGGNYGFGGGCNRGTKIARGKYLFFINPDVWLEPDCLEQLWRQAEAGAVRMACPLVLDYDNEAVQTTGSLGFDLFGNVVAAKPEYQSTRRFSVGTFFFAARETFQKLGGFDEEFFLYNEEMDLSWRAWIASEPVALIPTARIHHQAASSGNRMVENRTGEKRRFFANRNQLLTILKNAHGPLLLLAFTQTFLMTAEALAGALAARQLSFVRWALLKPLADCWRLRQHVFRQRQFNQTIRCRGDWWLCRHFFRFSIGRWGDAKRLLQFGIKIDPAKPAISAKP